MTLILLTKESESILQGPTLVRLALCILVSVIVWLMVFFFVLDWKRND